MTDAVRRQIEAAKNTPAAPRKPARQVNTPPTPAASPEPRESAVKPGLFGSHEVAEFPGIRFVATGATDACVQELTEVCQKHGMRCASTAHFMTQSESHAKAKK